MYWRHTATRCHDITSFVNNNTCHVLPAARQPMGWKRFVTRINLNDCDNYRILWLGIILRNTIYTASEPHVSARFAQSVEHQTFKKYDLIQGSQRISEGRGFESLIGRNFLELRSMRIVTIVWIRYYTVGQKSVIFLLCILTELHDTHMSLSIYLKCTFTVFWLRMLPTLCWTNKVHGTLYNTFEIWQSSTFCSNNFCLQDIIPVK